jgi:hypothetical protein
MKRSRVFVPVANPLCFCVVSFILCLMLPATGKPVARCDRVRSEPDAWVKARVDALVQVARAAYESDRAQGAYERTVDSIVSLMRQCRVNRDERFVDRYHEFVDYLDVLSLDRMPDHELGFNVTDKQYFAETLKYVEIPDFLLSPNFLRFVSRNETLKQAKAFLQQLNTGRSADAQLIFLSYRSRHLGTPDNEDSFLRLLIVVPGNAAQGIPEKWVQFGVPDRGAPKSVRNVSVVAALASADGTTNVYFKDYYRIYRRRFIDIKGRWELGEGDDNCVQCHKSGVIPIFPVAGTVSQDEQRALSEVNERFLTYGPPRFDRYLDTGKFGPGLGSSTAADIERRFGTRFSTTAVAHAMKCAACHNTNGLGGLNWPMDRIVISSYIKGRQMPLGYYLRDGDRSMLYKKLIEDYFAVDDANPGTLKSWLLGKLRHRVAQTGSN